METYEYIVVGAGSAGSVVTRRLIDAGASVLLLEAGGPDENPAIHEPGRWAELWMQPEDWAYQTVVQKSCGERQHYWPRGKVLGGSSSLNTMIYVRGNRLDYDSWAHAGNAGWGFDDVLAYFKRSEDFDGGESEHHAAGGPMRVTSRYEPHPLSSVFVKAAAELGIARNEDCNAGKQDGAGLAHLTTRNGRRESAASAFLKPVLGRPGLTVVTRARARRLLFLGTRCTGVEYSTGDQVRSAAASGEVIVSGGTAESPKLLMLSGIGDAQALRRLGIVSVADLPGVGRNLQDHLLCPLIYSARRPVPPTVPGLQQNHAHLFARSKPGLPAPDTQPLFFHIPICQFYGLQNPEHGFTVMPGIIRPASRGHLTLGSVDPEAPPVIDPCYLTQQADVDAMVFSFEQSRALLNSAAFDSWRDKELFPGSEVRGRKELEAFIRATSSTYHHQAGTCRMGVDELAVVDPELRVRGVERLRVVDASVMPSVTTGNTNAPTIMIAEKASDLILSNR